MSKIEQGKDHRGFFPRMSLSAQKVLTPPRHVGLGAVDHDRYPQRAAERTPLTLMTGRVEYLDYHCGRRVG